MTRYLETPEGNQIAYLGLGPEAGPLPAFFYFALSGQESLELHPYNQPALYLASFPLRVFSWTLPGHGEGFNKFHAMAYWAECMAKGEPLLEDFFSQVQKDIAWLFEEQLLEPSKLAAGGLSRGGFAAAHVAARVKEIQILLAFAPLTELTCLKEFADLPGLAERAHLLDLETLLDQLSHIQALRFYIGNLDTRVGTDACYHFIRLLAEKGHEQRLRDQKIELIITQSIGHKGHGTDPHIFKEGACWVKQHLMETLG